MGNYPSNGRGLVCIALAVAAGILSSHARPAFRPAGYLAKIGPSPLRFQAPRGPMNLPPLPMEDRNASAEISTKSTASVSDTSPLVMPASPLAGLLNDPITNPTPGEINSPDNTPPAANDLLIVTPQMLADYLKPAAGWTNAAHISVFGPVYFMPPTAAPPSSSATYKTE